MIRLIGYGRRVNIKRQKERANKKKLEIIFIFVDVVETTQCRRYRLCNCRQKKINSTEPKIDNKKLPKV